MTPAVSGIQAYAFCGVIVFKCPIFCLLTAECLFFSSLGHAKPPPLLRCRNCVETLNRNLEVLLNSITEGHLNQLIDIMMSKFVLSRDDVEYINAEQTRKARIRKYIETCCEKGEEASRMTLESLLTRKIIYMNPVN